MKTERKLLPVKAHKSWAQSAWTSDPLTFLKTKGMRPHGQRFTAWVLLESGGKSQPAECSISFERFPGISSCLNLRVGALVLQLSGW